MEGTMDNFASDKTFVSKGGQFKDVSYLRVGDKYKITGGKFKKYKTGTLCKVNDTYSDVIVDSEQLHANGKKLNEIISKVKNCYLHRFPNVVEMPEAKDLLVVENLEEFLKKEPEPEGVEDLTKEGLRKTAEDLVKDNEKLKGSGDFTKSEVLDLIKMICN
jgi:hypothetical protein